MQDVVNILAQKKDWTIDVCTHLHVVIEGQIGNGT